MVTPLDTIKSAVLGNPPDPNKQPDRVGVVRAFAEMQAELEASQSGAIVKATYSDLSAVTSVPYAGIMAWVMTGAQAGIYENTGSASAPAWARRGDIPQFFITAINTGMGTSDAIQATTDLAIPSQPGRALIGVQILASNETTTPTVSFNSGPAMTIVTNNGGEVPAEAFVNGSFITGFISDGGTKFRLLSNPVDDQMIAEMQSIANTVQNYYDLIVDLTEPPAVKLSETGDGVKTVFDLITPVAATNGHLYLDVYVGGSFQPKDGATYTVTNVGTKVAFSEAPPTDVYVYAESALTFYPVDGGSGPPADLKASDIENDSTSVAGATVADALDDLQQQIDDIPGGGGGPSFTQTIVNILDFIPTVQHAAIKNYTSTYDVTTAINNAVSAIVSGEIYFPSGLYCISNFVVLPKGITLVGAGRRDYWGNNNVGTVISGVGAGAASRWTDITGSDAADDKPLIVAGGNNVWLKHMTLLPGSGGRTIGFFVPCMKQCGIVELDAFEFTDACIYLDATWSDRNTTMKSLHPEIDPSTGMNEFSGRNFFLIGGGANGFAIKIQGTTRAHSVTSTESNWLWGWGGASDIVFECGRLGAVGANGGCLSYDGQLFDGSTPSGQVSPRMLQGLTVRSTSFRLSSAGRYHARFDRANRVILDGCYGESVGSNEPIINVTTRTQAGVDGILRVNDKLGALVTLNGVDTGYGGSVVPWEATRCITMKRTNQDRQFTPNLELGGNSNSTSAIPKIISFNSSGIIARFAHDSGGGSQNYFRIADVHIRPEADNALGCGTTGNRWTQVCAVNGTIVTSDLREKKVVGNLADDKKLMKVAERLAHEFIGFQWLDAIEKKGEENARIHFGVGAQTLENAMIAEGLVPSDYGMFCKDYLYDEVIEETINEDGEKETHEKQIARIDENGDHAFRLGVRPDLFNSMMLAYYFKKQTDLENRLTALEN